ncbi:MAG: hypothetical protein R3C32_01770 [Chloroflexota bacterium]
MTAVSWRPASARSPERQVTTLDCHDGIPVSPDREGVVDAPGMRRLAEMVVERGGNVTRVLSDAHASGVDVHQLNCTFYSALNGDDDRYVAARAIQLFARGIPQVSTLGCLPVRTITRGGRPNWRGARHQSP